MMRQGPTSNPQQEQLLALGKVLRDARESSGLSLDDLATRVLVRPRLLLALEQAQVNELPEPIYVQGIIRRYGDQLGLDGVQLSQYYVTPQIPKGGGRSWSKGAVQLRPYHLYGAYIALIAVSVSGLSYLMQRAIPQDSAEPILDPAAVEQLTLQRKAAPPTAEPKVEEVKAVPKAPIVVDAKVIQQSWVRVTADGKQAYEGILQEGAQQSWLAKESLTIRAGNAGGVVITYNQGQGKTMGKPGTVVEQTFKPGDGELASLSQ